MPSNILAAMLILVAQTATTIHVEGSPDATFRIACGEERFVKKSQDGIFHPPQTFEVRGGPQRCELLSQGALSVEVRNESGSYLRMSTAGTNSRMSFTVN